MGKAPQKVKLSNGKVAHRDLAAELSSVTVAIPIRHQSAKGWPMEPCVASGVHPSQAQELRDHFKKHNVNVDVNDEGDPIYESPGQKKKALACRGLHDNNSFS